LIANNILGFKFTLDLKVVIPYHMIRVNYINSLKGSSHGYR